MAEAVPVVSPLVGCLAAPATQEICLLFNLEDEIQRLKITHSRVQCVLEQNEIKQHMKEPVDQISFMKLKYANYDAENLLEQVEIESAERCKYSPIKNFFYSFPSRFRMAHKVKNLRKTLDAIAEEGQKFPVSDAGGNPQYGVPIIPPSRETCSLVNESEICGRQKEKEMIIGELCDKRRLERNDLSVFAIWGMGGLGKTTLAQLVLNDKWIEEQFDLRIWVCVSDNFDVKRILKDMIEYIDRKKCEDFHQLDVLQRQLQEKLMGKKYLLVLDDVWDVQSKTWETLKSILRLDSKGSIVIVTTRIKPTATMMATVNGVHEIGILSEADSWSLFKQRAFPNGEVNESLVQIGKAIVKKCRGLPLAIKVLGSLMESKVTKSEWLSIEKSEIWTVLVNENRDEIPVALKLSYYNLPSNMRKCFAYCCLYPKDYVMEVDELIQLWMANGFVQSSNGQKELPREGKKIYDELTWRCFFENIGTDIWGKRICKIHDLMHDLAISIVGQEIRRTGRFVNNFESEIPLGLRHVGIFEGKELSSSSAFNNKIQVSTGNSLCSFIAPSIDGFQSDDFFLFLSKQQYLRALLLRRCAIRNLDLVCQLKHLKFLCMNCKDMETLPESVTHLHNLQTLKLLESSDLRELPKELKVMKNLCFLEIDQTDSLESTPPEMGQLGSLCGLSIFIVGEDALQQIDQLKELNKLGGELKIKGLENVKSLEDAKSANLIAKSDLTRLSLYWKRDCRRSQHCEEVLQGLQPHDNIERVNIWNYPGSKFHKWMGSSAYVKLKSVQLSDCKECESFPALGTLPSLSELYIYGFHSVKRIGGEWYGDGKCSFPKLTTLKVGSMYNLEEWSAPNSNSVESFPRLTQLVIQYCRKLKSMPESLTKSLATLVIFKCPQLKARYGKPNAEGWPKISHIPTIQINGRVIQRPASILS